MAKAQQQGSDLTRFLHARRDAIVRHLKGARQHEEPERASLDDLPVTAIDPVEVQRTARMSLERRVLEERLAQLQRGEPITCEDCGELIPAARLKAVPATRRCFGCQSDVERTDSRIQVAALV